MADDVGGVTRSGRTPACCVPSGDARCEIPPEPDLDGAPLRSGRSGPYKTPGQGRPHMRSMLRSRPSPAMVVALIALFVALGGSASALVVVTTKNIKNGTIRSKDIHKRTIG